MHDSFHKETAKYIGIMGKEEGDHYRAMEGSSMDNGTQGNNTVFLAGTVVSVPQYSHNVCGEGFYTLRLEVPRLSGYCDVLPITVSERLLECICADKGRMLNVCGQLRSYNRCIGGSNRLLLTVFAKDLQQAGEQAHTPNEITLEGFICKPPTYRTTPFGREIADIMLAVNRSYGKSDYIPCICWGRNARYAASLQVGEKIRVYGRVQSREYEKALADGESETRTAYEVSVCQIERVCPATKEKTET
ncbi:MAG: single-stranded DNA-binding protein [Bacillota bacterium]|nr:single-stranded DNA-binding protein [Bacillota bacterium]